MKHGNSAWINFFLNLNDYNHIADASFFSLA